MIRKPWFFLLVVALVTGILYTGLEWYEQRVAELPYYGPQQDVDGVVAYHEVPSFEMLDHRGRKVSELDMQGQVMVVNFFFTSCPTICPKMMRSVQSVQEIYLDEPAVSIMSFTVDPKRDDVARLAQYADAYHVKDGKWGLLTGSKKEIYALARNGFYLSASEGDGGDHDFIHSESLVLIDKNGHIRGYYEGTKSEAVDRLLKDIAKLLRVES